MMDLDEGMSDEEYGGYQQGGVGGGYQNNYGDNMDLDDDTTTAGGLAEEDFDDGDIDKDNDPFVVIDSFFNTKGLVGQQLDSYNVFLTKTVQEIFADSDPVELFTDPKVIEGETEVHRERYSIGFGKASYMLPRITEHNDDEFVKKKFLWPSVARDRHLTYAAALFVDVNLGPN